MERPFEYTFPAIRGIQAGREFYVSQCPLLLVPKILLYDEEEIVPEMRAQRTINRSRVPEIANYMVRNRKEWVFSALTASIDGEARFTAFADDPEKRVGILRIPMSSRFIINDGQHRRAAIEAAMGEDPSLADESIGLVLFLDRGLHRSQQMFADLNRHAAKPSKSLGLLYDHRDPLAEIVRLVVFKSEFLNDVVEIEKTTMSARSRKLFTLSALYNGTRALLGSLAEDQEIQVDVLADHGREFWEEVAKHLKEWRLVRERIIAASEVRRDFIHSHAIILHALGKAGYDLVREYPNEWAKKLSKLSQVDWSRNHSLWEGRATIAGRVTKSYQNVTLTTNAIKLILEIPLSEEEECQEKRFDRGGIKNG